MTIAHSPLFVWRALDAVDSSSMAVRNHGCRFNMMRSLTILLIALHAAFFPTPLDADENSRPNFIVIIIDDLNDWIGCLGGHPQTQTPNIDRLARQGVLFRNAHVQATFCGPSRVSLLSGQMPATTGCYSFEPYESLDALKQHDPFPLHFRKNGYTTIAGGKIFHHGTGGGWVSKSWDIVFDVPPNPTPRKTMNWEKKIWDWGCFPANDDQVGDYQLALTAAETLQRRQTLPFFMMLGFRRPHVPLHVPQSWFDLHPIGQVQTALAPADDLLDLPHPDIALNSHAAPTHAELVDRNLLQSLTQAYLASISFVDHCIGEVLRGLKSGPHQDNTVVVVFSDHGFHLGEKQHWAKRTLWEETTRVPLLFAGPEILKDQSTTEPVGLIDLYPTLCEIAGISPPAGLEGESLQLLLQDRSAQFRRPAMTTLGPNQFSIRSKHWRYIRYEDGTEELYDHRSDPNEWRNLAMPLSPLHTEVILEHRKWLSP